VENGKLPVTYDDFAEFGIRRKAISSGLFELVTLGFVEITEKGRMAAAEFHVPSKYRLTYIFTRKPDVSPPLPPRRSHIARAFCIGASTII